MDAVIRKELGLGVSTPEGVCDWLGRERRELESLGRILTNREMFYYFRGENIVKNHTLNNVIAQHCLSIDFIKKVDYSEPDVFQDEFDRFLRTIGEFLDTEIAGKQFGSADVYDATKQTGEFRKMTSGIKK